MAKVGWDVELSVMNKFIYYLQALNKSILNSGKLTIGKIKKVKILSILIRRSGEFIEA